MKSSTQHYVTSFPKITISDEDFDNEKHTNQNITDEINKNTIKIIDNLLEPFPTYLISKDNYTSKNPIGIEVEVKWRYFFPTLWDKYLSHTTYSELTPTLQQQLHDECDIEELILLPKLNKTVECGIQKGKDKYWEFAFEPVTQINLIDYQLQILKKHNLIPKGEHSLHVTIANLKPTEDSYCLILLLEMLSCTKERIQSGFHPTKPKMSATWAKKGYGGLFQKNSTQLKYNTQSATELRTLILNTDNDNHQLFKTIAILSDIIIDKQNNRPNKDIPLWDNLKAEIKTILTNFNLPNNNWLKPNLAPKNWITYIENYPNIQHLITPAFKKIFPNL